MVPILVVVSSAHQVLYERYFLPSLPPGFAVREMNLGKNRGDGGYLSGEWQDAVVAKVTHALKFCETVEEGALFLVSDVDIQFFPPLDGPGFARMFAELNCDMAFQRERLREGDTEVNSGFYAARNVPAVRRLLSDVLDFLNSQQGDRNDQSPVNAMLGRGGVEWSFLDGRFYGRTHGFPPPRDIVMHHASWTFDVPQKIGQLERVRRVVKGGRLRATVETYFEILSRNKARKMGLRAWLRSQGDFFSRLPVKPLSVP